MKQFLFAVIGLFSLSFADVHPGLKNAIDNGDVKTAENLVKKFGVKDVYCPANLSFENAMTIYENAFSTNPLIMWKNCASVFIKNAENNVCGESLPLCKHYLETLFQKGDVDKIDSVFAQIIQSKLYIQKEKREVEQLEIVKASKQECMDQLDLHRKETVDSLINWHDIDCKILFDATICSKLFSTYGMVHIDSINKVFSSKSKNCKKKPTMTVKKRLEQEVLVNPFLYEIEYYGLLLSNKMKDPFYTNPKAVEMYKKLKSINIAAQNSIKNIKIYSDVLNTNTAAYCLSIPERGFNENACNKVINYVTNNFNLTSSKNSLIKEISNLYAMNASVPDSLIAFSCKLYPDIDKYFYKIMDVNIFDCNTINEYMSRNEACKNSNENYFWTAPSGIRYVCDNRKMREPRSKELENGICVNDAEIKNGMYCSIKNGWIENTGYKRFTDKRDSQIYRATKIGDQIWMAENLNYNITDSYCYENNPDNCLKHGRLYTWNSIMSRSDNGCKNNYEKCLEKQPIKGICPDGWHLPSVEDFNHLLENVGTSRSSYVVKLKASDEWDNGKKGSNTYGFNAYPAGSMLLTEEKQIYFINQKKSTSFWTVVGGSGNAEAYAFFIENESDKSSGFSYDWKKNGHSVRCLKDKK